MIPRASTPSEAGWSRHGLGPGRAVRRGARPTIGFMTRDLHRALRDAWVVAAVRTPIVSLSFSDDEFMSRRNTESIHGFYVNAPKTMKRFAPADIGARRIGHFGFFRPEHESSLWRAHLLPELR